MICFLKESKELISRISLGRLFPREVPLYNTILFTTLNTTYTTNNTYNVHNTYNTWTVFLHA